MAMDQVFNRFTFLRSRWTLPFFLILLLVGVLSVRLLSDPDLGTHLRNGKWIYENRTVPSFDTSTYTVTTHKYIDVHWLFQLFLFLFYSIAGYKGLSILVTLFSLVLFFLLFLRNREAKIPPGITCLVFLIGFLIIEQRLVMRPELITYILMTFMLWVLDGYFNKQKNLLFLLPVIMIFWCNIQGLFVLGFVLTGSYFISLIVRDRKIDGTFLIWMIASAAVCLVNPYFVRGIIFPFELFTQFDAQNIYHQHIKELSSFYRLDHFVFKDLLFIFFASATLLLIIFTYRKRKVHEYILVAVFLYLALVAVRNLALFAIVAMPIASVSVSDLTAFVRRENSAGNRPGVLAHVIFWLTIAVPVLLIPRVLTGSYYRDNDSYNKPGIGIDPYHQPVNAAAFLTSHGLDGRIINSIGAGGWLSWSLPQPVFIDGRLEVMKEEIYNEVIESWDGKLDALISRYKPDLIIYDYSKYYPWTQQLPGIGSWRVIYVDGFMTVFARGDYRTDVPAVNLATLPGLAGVKDRTDNDEIVKILERKSPGRFDKWLQGFWQKQDPVVQEMMNRASFCLQLHYTDAAEQFLLENLDRTRGAGQTAYYALADIYRDRADVEKAIICYQHILKFDPENETAARAIRSIGQTATRTGNGDEIKGPIDEARTFYNSGNQKYQYGDYTGAIADYNKAIELNPRYFKAYNNRGIAHAMGMNRFDIAVKDFDTAIMIKPDYGDAYLGRGTAKFRLNDKNGACRDWDKARSLGNPKANDLILLYCK